MAIRERLWLCYLGRRHSANRGRSATMVRGFTATRDWLHYLEGTATSLPTWIRYGFGYALEGSAWAKDKMRRSGRVVNHVDGLDTSTNECKKASFLSSDEAIFNTPERGEIHIQAVGPATHGARADGITA